MSLYTSSALAWINVVRKDTTRQPTWFDVADAYDAGLKHASANRTSARQQLREVDLKKAGMEAPCDTSTNGGEACE